MNERRKERRKSLMAYTQVHDLYGGYLLGYLGDMNVLGVMVISDKALAENSEMTIAIEIPDLPDIAAPRMTIPARVAWVQPDISPQYFNIGFEFQEITSQQKKIIEAIIAHYEFRRDTPKYFNKPNLE